MLCFFFYAVLYIQLITSRILLILSLPQHTVSLWTNPMFHRCSAGQDLLIHITWRYDTMESLQSCRDTQSHRSKHLSLTVTGQQFLLHFYNFLCFFPIPISLKSSENLLFFFFFPNVPGTFSPFLAPFSLCSRASRQQQIRLRIRSLGKPTWFRL